MIEQALPAGRLVRRPWFWVAYVALAVVSLAVALKLFPTAMPIVNVDIAMSRDEAIDKARALAATLKLAPPDTRAAVQFRSDGSAQNYVELEGGGKDAFAADFQYTDTWVRRDGRWKLAASHASRLQQ